LDAIWRTYQQRFTVSAVRPWVLLVLQVLLDVPAKSRDQPS
jgi:hypothetical protein